jgi:hypothetical protein
MKKRKAIVKRKVRSSGRKRKNKLSEGSTPRFPVDPKKEPDAVLPQPPASHPAEK